MKFRLSFGLAALAAMALAHPATAQERVFEGSDGSCSIEVRGSDKALLMRAKADGTAQIGLMFKDAVDAPGRTREGYFYLGLDTSTSGPVTYRDGYEGEFSSGYIAEMGTADLWWMVDPVHGRLSLAVGSPARNFEARTGEDIVEFEAFRTCLEKLAS